MSFRFNKFDVSRYIHFGTNKKLKIITDLKKATNSINDVFSYIQY